jgi:hypothetical protein
MSLRFKKGGFMSLLHPSLILTLSLSLNTAIASENLENTTHVNFQSEYPRLLAGILDERRRGTQCDLLPPKVWALNISCEELSQFCYIAQEEVTLWLPQNKRAGLSSIVIKIRRTQGVELPWTASTETVDWPVAQVPIQSGNRYSVIFNRGGPALKVITLHQVPAEYTVAEKAEWMKEKGCIDQAEMLFMPSIDEEKKRHISSRNDRSTEG